MICRSFRTLKLSAALGFTVVASAAVAADQVDLSFITDKGWVQFTVGAAWKVLKMETKNPVRVAVFQLPNPAEKGTSGSTNASVITYELDSPEAEAGFGRVRQKYAKGRESRISPWEVFQSDFKEGNISYSGRVGFRDIADVHVSIVFAWPHLPKNSKGYDSAMEQTFLGMLNSVNGELGKYPKEKGGVLRRPL